MGRIHHPGAELTAASLGGLTIHFIESQLLYPLPETIEKKRLRLL